MNYKSVYSFDKFFGYVNFEMQIFFFKLYELQLGKEGGLLDFAEIVRVFKRKDNSIE